MIDDLNLEFEDHDRGRGRRRRTERGGQDQHTSRGESRQIPRQYPRQEQGWRTARPGSGGDYEGYDPSAYPSGGYDRHRDREATGRQPRYDAGGQPRYDTGGQPRYDTGGQPRYDTGGQPRHDRGYEDPRYAAGGPPPPDPRYDTGSRAYRQLEELNDPPQRRGAFIQSGYDDGGILGGAGYDDNDDDGGRGSRRPRKTKKKRRGRSFLALFLTLLLLGGLAGGAYLAYGKISDFFLTPDYSGNGTSETVQVEIKQGELLADIADTLVKADVVKSYKAFVQAAEANKDSMNIQPGLYTLHKQMSGKAAVLALLDLKNRNVKGTTIPEGLIAIQIYDLLSQKLNIPVNDFKKAADPKKLGVPDGWFKRLDGKKVAGGIEGFLFPSTYEFPPKPTAEQVLKIMVTQFLSVTDNMQFAQNAQRLGISPYEALVAASIGQAEVVKAEDYPKVARVLYNRVYKDGFPCKCLQIDSAVNYWLRITGKVPKDSSQILRGEQHNPLDPYNTFDAPKGSGLPIGPISNPGEQALKGAIQPAAGPWTYFMTVDKAGTMGYATSWEGHCQNYAKAVKNGILTGTCNG
jgi:UPF0755 protein